MTLPVFDQRLVATAINAELHHHLGLAESLTVRCSNDPARMAAETDRWTPKPAKEPSKDDERPRPSYSINDLQKAAAALWDVTIADIKGRSKKPIHADPRHVAMYVARQDLRLSFPHIARNFNRKDHTTVMHAVKRVENSDVLRTRAAMLREATSRGEVKMPKPHLLKQSCRNLAHFDHNL